MSRAVVSDVRNILPESTELTDAQIRASIDAATCLVDRVAECSDLTDECLLQVEIWLSAHYCVPLEPTLSISSEKSGCSGSSVDYGVSLGEGIKGTTYGQMANTLSGGCLAELDKQPANLFSIGCV